MSVLLAVPCYGGMSDKTAMGLFNLGKFFQAQNIAHDLVTVVNSSLISKGRSRIANAFLHATSFDYLMFIDADIGFSSDDFLKLFQLGAPIAAAPYSMKTLPPRFNFQLTEKFGRVVPHPQFKAVQVEHIGTGFMLIHRRVFLEMNRAYPELHFIPDPGSSHRPFNEKEMKESFHYFETFIDPMTKASLPEDLSFCHRARRMGIEIWMPTDTNLNHTGSWVFQNGDLQNELEAMLRKGSLWPESPFSVVPPGSVGTTRAPFKPESEGQRPASFT